MPVANAHTYEHTHTHTLTHIRRQTSLTVTHYAGKCESSLSLLCLLSRLLRARLISYRLLSSQRARSLPFYLCLSLSLSLFLAVTQTLSFASLFCALAGLLAIFSARRQCNSFFHNRFLLAICCVYPNLANSLKQLHVRVCVCEIECFICVCVCVRDERVQTWRQHLANA